MQLLFKSFRKLRNALSCQFIPLTQKNGAILSRENKNTCFSPIPIVPLHS